MHKLNSLGISKELIIQRFCNGIKLVLPSVDRKNEHTVKHLLQLPVDVCFVDNAGSAQLMNERAILRSGFDSFKKCFGKTVFDVATNKTAEFVTQQHKLTKEKLKINISEYNFNRKDNYNLHCLLLSYPLYNERNKLVGVLDLSIASEYCSIAESLFHLMNFGLLNESLQNRGQIYFSKRETECLNLLVAGNTAKEIGSKLNLSHRTVEHYLENCMNKIGVSTRYELISKFSKL